MCHYALWFQKRAVTLFKVHELAACLFTGQVHIDVPSYMDDILIYSKLAEDHVVHVKAVFEGLAESNWHIKEKKSALPLPEVDFLGREVSA